MRNGDEKVKSGEGKTRGEAFTRIYLWFSVFGGFVVIF